MISTLGGAFIISGLWFIIAGILGACMMNAIMQERWGFGNKHHCRKGWVYQTTRDIWRTILLGVLLVVAGTVLYLY